MTEYIALDCETELIPDRTAFVSRTGAEVKTSPYVVPRLVCGSASTEGTYFVSMAPEFLRFVHDHLDGVIHLIFHNFAFDYGVLCAADPTLLAPLDAAVEAGRVHDTMYLDTLLRLATGEFDAPVRAPETGTWSTPDVRSRPLDTLAYVYCGRHLDKDPAVRLAYGQFLGRPLVAMPEQFKEYARQDAAATLDVFLEIRERLDKFGLGDASESYQVKCSLVCADMDQRGLHIDRALASQLYTRFASDLRPLQAQLVRDGLGRWEAETVLPPDTVEGSTLPPGLEGQWIPLPGETHVQKTRRLKSGDVRVWTAQARFALNTRAIQTALVCLATEAPPLRADGTLSLDYDFWNKTIPTTPSPLRTWLHHEKVKKVLTTYLSTYANTDRVFPKWHVIGARSGRMSASAPSVQNVPKRKYGIRSLFLAPPGHTLVKGDYAGQEMFTLAEVMLGHGIKGPLLAALAQPDIHRYAAARVLGKPASEVTKDERQGQKALSFGVPGGLGAKKLADYAYENYGVVWTEAEAAERRARFLTAFTDIADYLSLLKIDQDTALRHVSGRGRRDWAAHLGLPVEEWNVVRALTRSDNPELQAIGQRAERVTIVTLPTGRRRANCRFTEAANTGFQGLASDVTKLAAWRARQVGLQVVLLCHDEIVVAVPLAHDDDYALPKEQLTTAMLAAFREVCPTAGQLARVEVEGPIDRWGPSTDAAGKVLDMAAPTGTL